MQHENLPIPVPQRTPMIAEVIRPEPHPHLDPKRKVGRPALHRRSWPHPFPSYRDRVTFIVGMVRGNDYIYVRLLADNGEPLTKYPVSLGIRFPNDESEVIEVYGTASEMAIERWLQAKNDALLGQTRGRKNTFGYFAQPVIRRLHEQAMEHGHLPAGPLRDEKWPDLVLIRSPSQRRYNGSRGGRLRKVNREELQKRQQALENQAIANGLRPAKARSFIGKAKQVQAVARRWANVPLSQITSDALDEWARTLTVTGGPHKGEPVTHGTLNSLDSAFAAVWNEARAAGAVPKTRRPAIQHHAIGRKGAKRNRFTVSEIEDLARYVASRWDTAGFEERVAMLYPALLTCTGIRAGLELLNTKIGQYETREIDDPKHQRRRLVHLVKVSPNAGKYEEERLVAVYVGADFYFPIIRMMRDVINEWRNKLPLREFRNSGLFGPERYDTSEDYARSTIRLFTEVGILYDQDGKRRTSYCLRHFFATQMIRKGVDLPALASWMGTSVRMLIAHYHEEITARDAWKIDGWQPDDG